MSYRLPPVNQCLSTPLQQSPELTVIQIIIRQLLLTTNQSVEAAERLRGDIHPTYLLQLSDGSRAILKCSPLLSTRLLRREQRRLEDESRVLNLINRNTNIPVPRRMKYESHGSGTALRPPYLIRSYVSGTTLSELRPSLSEADQARIDQSLGVYLLALSSLTARNFGAPHAVHASNGYSTWREAFLTMLEAVLRDAEDMLVSIPYDTVRYYCTAHADALNAVTTPRLTALDVCLPENVLIDPNSREIQGLLGLGDVIWGDPNMAAVLEEPTPAFLEGYGRRDSEQDENEHARKLLYTVYRAIVSVVKRHFRPRDSEDELEARRVLGRALNELAAL
ncbi:hypothetical protein NA57DRAFT_42470 [Rhizodiscina lignyota]|uniref:Aminoglycoside phosphotransferase domain-containing protein n=1 Tax=Rhizodiscina lignyota TaxID=1504668 RepID=A0A9P4IB47_9PEZI|nr:hypothetical protein NA57DRAFT_42470 [Rhizodiscina lignyota]